ncbi:MAG: carboxypeptidase regulatory-like domain-containing protein [Verrucomicrobia bacterium]|nr:carboxypeptidase regulatory-like domain-containing protein [Verrucomicrobiota bacterium]
MQTSFVRSFIIALVTALAVAILPAARAQGLVSSGIAGSLVDSGGKAIAGATITAVHVPTNTTYTAVTTPAGRFKFSGLRIGGPYTITGAATGYEIQTLPDVYVQLSQDTDVVLSARGEVVQLEKFEVKADANALDATSTGAGSVLDNRGIRNMPTQTRSFADMMKTNPFVSIRAGQQVTALGMNNRYNSISIDGARQNDNFGLSATGLFSLKNPFSLDALENFSVDLTPYDVTQSGFAGASINAVSKSGTNEFHGSLYYIYSSYRWQGKDVYGTTSGTRPSVFYERTQGATFGGPIIKDKLFFFLNWEEYRNPSGGAVTPGFKPDSGALTAITSQFASLPGSPAFGSFGAASQALLSDRKKLAKLDWNITKDQRLSVRYSTTEGNQPFYPDFSTAGAPSSMPSLTPAPSYVNGVTSFTNSKSYSLAVKEKVWASQLFSNWTPDLKTELAFSKNNTSSLRSTPVNLPEIVLLGVPGTSTSSGASVTSSTALLFGTDYSSMGNGVIATTKDYSGNATYTWRDFTFKAGADREESDFENLFRNGSYGRFVYNYTPGFDLANATPIAFVRNVSSAGFAGTDVSAFDQTGVFGQIKWEPTQRFNATFGLRYDMIGSPIKPPYNPAFESAFGVTNAASINGSSQLAPRFAFNYALDNDRIVQLRGGVGVFLGRSPWVWLSNSYGNAGYGRFTRTFTTATGNMPTLSQYLGGTYTNSDPVYKFDPANPLGTTNAQTGGGDVAFMKPGLKLPTNLRGNLAVDYKLPVLSAKFSVEWIHTDVQQAIFYDQINLVPGGKGADGRTYFRRYTSATNTTLVPLGTSGGVVNTYNTNFSRVFRFGNTGVGGSDYVAVSLDRPLKDGWAYNVTYTRGKATEAQPGGSSTASSQWAFNVVYNQNQVEKTRSDYEVQDRIQASVSKELNFLKRYKTTVALYYEGRSGVPYSYVYPGDLNYDGNSQNDALAVPTGLSDARFDFSGLTDAQKTAYMNYIQSTGLSKYAGSYAPRNAFIGPWQNRLDLHVSQEVKVTGPVQVEVFADFINFGSWLSKSMFNYIDTLGSPTNSNQIVVVGTNANTALYNAAGQIKLSPTGLFNSDGTVATASSSQFLPNNGDSRWRIQAGVRLKF